MSSAGIIIRVIVMGGGLIEGEGGIGKSRSLLMEGERRSRREGRRTSRSKVFTVYCIFFSCLVLSLLTIASPAAAKYLASDDENAGSGSCSSG